MVCQRLMVIAGLKWLARSLFHIVRYAGITVWWDLSTLVSLSLVFTPITIIINTEEYTCLLLVKSLTN